MDACVAERFAIPMPDLALRNGRVAPFAPLREDGLPIMEYRRRRQRWLRRVAYHEAGHAVVAWALGEELWSLRTLGSAAVRQILTHWARRNGSNNGAKDGGER